MKMSYHLQKRMSERNISHEVIKLIMDLGEFSKNGERVILDEKTISTAIECTGTLRRKLISLRGKKGASVALGDKAIITSFFHYGKRNAKNKQK